MWQAISRLLSEQLGEGEIELRNELPGGEVHAAWHLRYAGHDFFVKCDERELLPGFTAEADQLELLSRSKTVTVPKVWAVGADRDYSFLVMDYLPPRPLDAHSAFILGQQIARLHQWSDQPQFGLDFDNSLSTTPQPNTWQRRWSTFLLNNGLAGSWNWQQRKGSLSAISTPSSSIFSSVWPRINRSLLCCTAIYGPATVRWVRMARTFSTLPATGVTESATWRCYRCILNSRHKSMTAISQYPRYLPISLNVNRFTNSTRC
ncbi:fructosamine kinase family protein [Shigella boydii 3594-74]|nr:fructosamine kinase family protein [Shigella boydii 3594-74]